MERVVYGIVYKATNKINNKSYIGQTTRSLDRRKYEHIYNAHRHTFRSYSYFHSAVEKYGSENFEWSILMVCYSEEELNHQERCMIEKYDSFNNGYNLDSGGKIRKDFRHTEESKNKISKGNFGQKRSLITRSKISNALKGKPKSAEHSAQMRRWNIGRKKTTDQIKKMIEVLSKSYIITTPDHIEIEVKNLKEFCRNYKEGLLDDSALIKVAKGKQKKHKKYLCKYKEVFDHAL